ncbi:DUF1064 domain-containing protein [Parabacteroides provencensis]|uniref:DUF1064 domain-containing protein n=1 Tax=Parabacteroides provencensis TaxID=1944636 RepID=UPI001E40CBDD|nr:DUF1064 domain-containing protein [Parabacteroides provencensis]
MVTGIFPSGLNFWHYGYDLYRFISNQSKERQEMVNKYRNKKVLGYDSKKEKRRAEELKLLQRAGMISELKEQVKFELIPSHYENINGKKKCIERACHYIADFVYVENSKLIVEDVKSPITRKNKEYIIKKKLMLYQHGIKIREK